MGFFLTIFGHFCSMGTFYKKSASVTHNYIWNLNIMLSLKLMSQFRENLLRDRRMDGRTDGRMDRHYFIGPFQPYSKRMYWLILHIYSRKGCNFYPKKETTRHLLDYSYTVILCTWQCTTVFTNNTLQLSLLSSHSHRNN